MIKKFLPALLLSFSLTVFSQSPKTVLVEHFTNTKCSICASRNPGFYNVLSGYPQVIHIAFHPSAPYSSCYFNQQNVTENDDRTKFYGAYGSTPKFVLNGALLPSTNPAITNTTLDTALNQTSPLEISATEELLGADSVKVRVVVRTTGSIGATQLLLFAGVAQDTIQYSAGNGEQLHHDVFRKALTGAKGDTIPTPALNDSLVLTYNYKIAAGWRGANLNTIAWVQLTDTKQVLNAGKSHRVADVVSGINEAKKVSSFSVYPNPFSNELQFSGYNPEQENQIEVFDVLGNKMFTGILSGAHYTINAIRWSSGIYFVRVNNTTKRIIKE
jgi:hypothetical protein